MTGFRAWYRISVELPGCEKCAMMMQDEVLLEATLPTTNPQVLKRTTSFPCKKEQEWERVGGRQGKRLRMQDLGQRVCGISIESFNLLEARKRLCTRFIHHSLVSSAGGWREGAGREGAAGPRHPAWRFPIPLSVVQSHLLNGC